jgi:hypothetical protein|tara:strand:+ start:875 stop:1615 length:741 start_codon:yes stop_codon:yes gene_type:complete
MSFLGGGSSGGGQTQTTTQQPYAPAQPALNQIISEAGKIYQQGPAAAGYVAPTTQTTQGLAGMETMANAAQQQLADTLSGQYLNPFLQPLMQKTAGDIYSNVAGQFSGAGRTPGSPLMQNQVTQQVAQAALPLAFQQYNIERGNQLGIAQRAPQLTQVGAALENIQRQQNMAPFGALQQYGGMVSPIASGFPIQSGQVNTRANPLTTGLGGAVLGSMIPQSQIPGVFGGMSGAVLGGIGGLLGGLL